MSFRDWQPKYADYRIATFPVRVSNDGKVPAIRGWQMVGLLGSAKLAQKFANADAFGFCPGRRSRVTILDIDTPDERILADALDLHGQTPIIVRSGSGNHQAWYRFNGEKRLIRPDPDKPIDILGSGLVVAPPSVGTKSNYQFIEGGLDDLDRLPILRGTKTAPPLLLAHSIQAEVVSEGRRNDSLWLHCMQSARYCDDFDALLDVARTRNEDFSPPLSDSEVVKLANSAWGKTERGENWFGRHGAFFSTEEANCLIASDQDIFVLLAFLRANNRPGSIFMVANGLAKKIGWSRKRLAATRLRLEQTHIDMVQKPSTFNGPALYSWRSRPSEFHSEDKLKNRRQKEGTEEVLVEDRWSILTTLGQGRRMQADTTARSS